MCIINMGKTMVHYHNLLQIKVTILLEYIDVHGGSVPGFYIIHTDIQSWFSHTL